MFDGSRFPFSLVIHEHFAMAVLFLTEPLFFWISYSLELTNGFIQEQFTSLSRLMSL